MVRYEGTERDVKAGMRGREGAVGVFFRRCWNRRSLVKLVRRVGRQFVNPKRDVVEVPNLMGEDLGHGGTRLKGVDTAEGQVRSDRPDAGADFERGEVFDLFGSVSRRSDRFHYCPGIDPACFHRSGAREVLVSIPVVVAHRYLYVVMDWVEERLVLLGYSVIVGWAAWRQNTEYHVAEVPSMSHCEAGGSLGSIVHA